MKKPKKTNKPNQANPKPIKNQKKKQNDQKNNKNKTMRGKPSHDQSSAGVSGCLGWVSGLVRGGFSTDSFFLMVFDWFWICLVWFVCFFLFVAGGFLDWSGKDFPQIFLRFFVFVFLFFFVMVFDWFWICLVWFVCFGCCCGI